MPQPTPRAAKVVDSPPAIAWKVEIAHWLFTTLRITGARYTCAKVSAVWKSASAVAPSPIQPDAIFVSPLIADLLDDAPIELGLLAFDHQLDLLALAGREVAGDAREPAED